MADALQSAGGSVVQFGKFIAIHSSKRLKAFDNGASLAYQAVDSRDPSKKFIAIISDALSLPRASDSGVYEALADISLMRLIGSGVVRWPLDGRQKYVFLYQGGLGDCIVPKGKFSNTQWRHPEISSRFIQPMARVLKEIEMKSFVHGNIRPDNIFYSDNAKDKPIVLGDCLSAQHMSTQPALFLSIERAMAEPMGRGTGSIADDIYAFGVSLAMFLRKNDELAGMSDEAIIRKKLDVGSFATIVGNERFQVTFIEILRGLLHDDPNLRWGLEEIFMWLDGTRMNPAANLKRAKANRTITFIGKKYLYTDTLAMDVHKNPNELATLISDGMLHSWLEKSIDDKAVFERYETILERVNSNVKLSNDNDYLACQVTMALNPMLPIFYKKRVFTHDGLGALLAVDAAQDKKLSFYKEVINNNILDHALDVKEHASQGDTLLLLKMYDRCRVALKQTKVGHGIERCIYMMCKNAPCLSPKFKNSFVHTPLNALITYERLSKAGGQTSLFMDRHSVAFFSVHAPNLIEHSLYELNDPNKDNKIAGNLKFFSTIQKRKKGGDYPAVASVFLDSLSGVFKRFNNKELRKQLEGAVKAAASAGDLITMWDMLGDDNTLSRDKRAFGIARKEYKFLQDEYNKYNAALANKATYGIVNGRNTAAVVSWMFATVLTLLSVFAFISGYKIF